MPRTAPDLGWRGAPPVRRLLRVAVTAAVILLASTVSGAPVTSARGGSAPSVSAVPAPPPSLPPSKAPASLVTLQMNLCNSGMALSCFTGGKAVDEAVGKIHRYAPDIVTVQEICRADLYSLRGWGKLAQAMADAHGGQVAVSFVPARNRYTGSPYRCVNGEQYGVALIHHLDGRDEHQGWYTTQDGSDEIRAWTCITVVEGRLTGCTTHLSTVRAVAMRQCRELMSILDSPWAMPDVVVAGDLNLVSTPGQRYDVGACAPAAYGVKGDGALQHVLFTGGLRWAQGRTEAMKLTDHPLLYERFRLAQP